jgi:hypothetical protein
MLDLVNAMQRGQAAAPAGDPNAARCASLRGVTRSAAAHARRRVAQPLPAAPHAQPPAAPAASRPDPAREQQLWERQQAMYDRVLAQWDAERQVGA